MSAGEESHLRSAVLLEQVAMCLLRMHNPRRRRAAFQLILASNRYSMCGQRKHTVRCLLHAWKIYQGKGWNYVADHVMVSVARHAYLIGSSRLSLTAFAALLANNSQPPAMQREQLAEFVRVYRSFASVALPSDVPVPIIDHSSIQVYAQSLLISFRSYIS